MGWGSSALDKQLDKEAAPLIAIYKARASDPNYYKRVRVCIDALKNASTAIATAGEHLGGCLLDDEHASEVNSMLAQLSEFGANIDDALKRLFAYGDFCGDLAWNISLCTAVPEEIKPGRPRVNFVSEVRALMKLYEKVSGKPVVSPKDNTWTTGKLQHSTQFIDRCLRKINPKATTAMAVTCIENAQEWAGKTYRLGWEK